MANFQKLRVWQKADELALEVYRQTERFPRREMFGMTAQLRRAAVSVPTNIAEGYSRQTDKELSNFLNIARGSLAEIEYLIMFSKKLGYLKTPDKTLGLTSEVSRLLWSFRKSIGDSP